MQIPRRSESCRNRHLFRGGTVATAAVCKTAIPHVGASPTLGTNFASAWCNSSINGSNPFGLGANPRAGANFAQVSHGVEKRSCKPPKSAQVRPWAPMLLPADPTAYILHRYLRHSLQLQQASRHPREGRFWADSTKGVHLACNQGMRVRFPLWSTIL